MSAYQVSRAHIATLACWALGGSHKINSSFGSALEVANKLAIENVKSLKARYPQDDVDAHVFGSDQSLWNACRMELFQPLVIIKAAQCLMYQSCEHDEWEGSEACRICRQIISAAISELPGYSEADGWSIDDAPRAASRPVPLMMVRRGAK